MLNPNPAGTKANFDSGRHIWRFKMAASENQIFHFRLNGSKKVACLKIFYDLKLL